MGGESLDVKQYAAKAETAVKTEVAKDTAWLSEKEKAVQAALKTAGVKVEAEEAYLKTLPAIDWVFIGLAVALIGFILYKIFA